MTWVNESVNQWIICIPRIHPIPFNLSGESLLAPVAPIKNYIIYYIYIITLIYVWLTCSLPQIEMSGNFPSSVQQIWVSFRIIMLKAHGWNHQPSECIKYDNDKAILVRQTLRRLCCTKFTKYRWSVDQSWKSCMVIGPRLCLVRAVIWVKFLGTSWYPCERTMTSLPMSPISIWSYSIQPPCPETRWEHSYKHVYAILKRHHS